MMRVIQNMLNWFKFLNRSPIHKTNPKKEIVSLTEEEKKGLFYFIGSPLRSANRLMGRLYKDDTFYKQTARAWVEADDSKKLFLYGVCKEVIKTCALLHNDKEALEGRPKTAENKRIENLVIGGVIDLQNQRIRKMSELLTKLILFRQFSKNNEDYRMHHSAENLDLLLSRQKDFADLFNGATISNVQKNIDYFKECIFNDLHNTNRTDIWFLNMSRIKDDIPSVFAGRKEAYLSAIFYANDSEKAVLGTSYGKGFSRPSVSMHPNLISHGYEFKNTEGYELIMGNIMHLAMLCMHIMDVAYKLFGEKDPNGIRKFMGDDFEKSEASDALHPMKKSHEVGDIVLTVFEDLAEVVEVRESKYGYKAYKLSYISSPPLDEYPEDWIEAQNILGRLVNEKNVLEFYKKNSTGVKDPVLKEIMTEVLKQPSSELLKSAKKTFLELHKNGILIPMLVESGYLKPRKRVALFDSEKE